MSKRTPPISIPAVLAAATGLALLLTGCGSGALRAKSSLGTSALSGSAFGGQQPLVHSAIQAYAVGTGGDGSAATPLLPQPVYTDASGAFSFGAVSCPSPDSELYLVATGGDPNGSATVNNGAALLVALAGRCSDQASSFVSLNELTTVATAYALSSFTSSAAQIGYAATNAVDFTQAVQTANGLVNYASGRGSGPDLPYGQIAPTTKMATLADVLAGCVNSAGGVSGDGSICGSLFLVVSVGGGSPPANIFDAALSIARHPAAEVAAIYNLGLPSPPFLPTLSVPPTDWTLAITSPVATPSLFPAPGSFADNQSVTLSSATAGATMYYTTDGSLPTASSTLYNGAIPVSATTSIHAIALLNGIMSLSAAGNYTVVRPATMLAFVEQPSESVVGSNLSPGVQVAVEDAHGNMVTAAGGVVSLALAANPANAVLSGLQSATVVNGLATFNNLGISLAGSGYQLIAASSGLSSATSAAFVVDPLAGSAVTDYWRSPGNTESPFNTILTAAEQASAVPPGFMGLQIDFSSWFTPAEASSPALWQSSTSDPTVTVLFNLNSYIQVNNGAWKRYGNSAATEAAILASSSTQYPLPSIGFGLSAKYYYMTTSASGNGWIPPMVPAINPLVAPPAKGLSIHAPANALPAADSDGYFAIFQPDGSVLECYSGIVLSSGTIICGTYNVTHSWSPLTGAEGGVMASTVPVYAGLIRETDIDSGVIAHALNICISPTQLANSFVSPAVSFDRNSGYTGTLPMGSHLAIPLSVNLAAHSFQSAVGRMIAVALQNYGAFLLDRGGSNGFTIRSESNVTNSAFTQAWDWNTQQDLDWILSQLQLLR